MPPSIGGTKALELPGTRWITELAAFAPQQIFPCAANQAGLRIPQGIRSACTNWACERPAAHRKHFFNRLRLRCNGGAEVQLPESGSNLADLSGMRRYLRSSAVNGPESAWGLYKGDDDQTHSDDLCCRDGWR